MNQYDAANYHKSKKDVLFYHQKLFTKKRNNADKANMHSRTMWSLKESHVYDGLLFILLSEGERYEEGEAYEKIAIFN